MSIRIFETTGVAVILLVAAAAVYAGLSGGRINQVVASARPVPGGASCSAVVRMSEPIGRLRYEVRISARSAGTSGESSATIMASRTTRDGSQIQVAIGRWSVATRSARFESFGAGGPERQAADNRGEFDSRMAVCLELAAGSEATIPTVSMSDNSETTFRRPAAD
jgi:hypothetical protein